MHKGQNSGYSITSSARASKGRRDREAERLGGGQVDDQIKLGRLLDRQVARLCSAQNIVDVIGSTSEQVRKIRSIGHQTSRIDVLARAIDRRQPGAHSQNVDTNPVGNDERVANNIKCIRSTLDGFEGGHDIFRFSNFRCSDFQAELTGRGLNFAFFHYCVRKLDISQDR